MQSENETGVTYHISHNRQSLFPAEIWHTVNAIKSSASPERKNRNDSNGKQTSFKEKKKSPIHGKKAVKKMKCIPCFSTGSQNKNDPVSKTSPRKKEKYSSYQSAHLYSWIVLYIKTLKYPWLGLIYSFSVNITENILKNGFLYETLYFQEERERNHGQCKV